MLTPQSSQKMKTTGNCSAEKVEILELGVARYASIYLPSGGTCLYRILLGYCLVKF